MKIRPNQAVVLILAYKSDITSAEQCSLKQCTNVLRNYDIHIVCPQGLDVSAYKKISNKLAFTYLSPHWQAGLDNVNRLKSSPLLYRIFSAYEYILFHDLDAFVFRDELCYWCNAGYDYIGAPWFDGFSKCTEQSPFIGVGNGGFSLRKIRSALRVLRSFSYIRKPRELLRSNESTTSLRVLRSFSNICKSRESYQCNENTTSLFWSFMSKTKREKVKLVKNMTIANNTFWPYNDFRGPEDIFWGLIVPRNFPWFLVAPFEEARRFSAEANPALLYRLNKQQLPFGCHRWASYDPEFWRPHIRKHQQECISFDEGEIAR